MSSVSGNSQTKRERSPDVPLAPVILQQIPTVAGAGSAASSPVVAVTSTVSNQEESRASMEPCRVPLPFSTQPQQLPTITAVATPSQAAPGPGNPTPGPVFVPSSGATVCLGDVSAAAVAASVVGSGGDGARSLRVEDALSYLDVVKNRFSSRPNVYAEFLDVMRDFKSQSIDTSTVVNRVNELFENHNDLIQAFNQFLPANQRATAATAPLPHPAVISAPSGPHPQIPPTIVPGGLMSLSLASADASGLRTITSNIGGPGAKIAPTSAAPGYFRGGLGPGLGIVNLGVTPPASAAPSGAAAAPGGGGGGAAPPGSGGGGGGGDVGNRNQPEFSQAITYVNKIKTRFSHQPDKYKQFLEILQKYQQQGQGNLFGGMLSAGPLPPGIAVSGGGGIQPPGGAPRREPGGPDRPFSDLQVYKQVSRLFEGQSDLLHEFKTFLPEVNQAMLSGEMLCNVAAVSAMTMVPQPTQHSAVPQVSPGGGTPTGSALTPSPASGPLVRDSGGMRRTPNSITVNAGAAGDGLQNKTGPVPSPSALPVTGGSGERIRTSSMSSNPPPNPPTAVPPSGAGMKRAAQMVTSGAAAGAQATPQGPPPSAGGGSGGSGGKRSRLVDVSFTDTPRHVTMEDFEMFDKAENELNNEETIKDFYRIIHLYNENILRPVEVVHTLVSLFGQNSDVLNYMKRAMNYSNVMKDSSPSNFPMASLGNVQGNSGGRGAPGNGDRHSLDYRNEVDINTCLNFQQSYRQLPDTYRQPRCTGRDDLCREVLNDKYISCASWLSEDTSVVSSKKNVFEEYLYQVEDQRYELDMVIDLNYNMMQILNAHLREIENMAPEQAERFTLDENLGCPSGILMRKALQRLYGEKTRDIISGLRRNPQMAIPLVLRRLMAKDEEWRCARTGFNDTWRDAHEKYYLKSLDYQGPYFKQNDFKVWRVKTLLSQIRTAHEEWKAQGQPRGQAQYKILYPRDCPFTDAASLIIHHVKRQTSLSKEDKGRIKALVRRTLPLIFNQETTPLSDDEEDDMDEPALDEDGNECGVHSVKTEPDSEHDLLHYDVEERYSLLFGNNYWYVFLRLHHLLCERLVILRTRGQYIASEREDEKKNERSDSTAEALRLRKPCPIPPEKYYEHALEMVKALLEGNMDQATFEDQLRELFSINAYIWFTMDKLMMTLTRQLQHIVTDDRTWDLTRLWRVQRGLDSRETGAGGSRNTCAERLEKEERYRRKAMRIINGDQDDFCYRLEVGWPTGELRVDIVDPRVPKIRSKVRNAGEGRDRGTQFTFSSLSELRSNDSQAESWCRFLEELERRGEMVAGSLLDEYRDNPRLCNRPLKVGDVRRCVLRAMGSEGPTAPAMEVDAEEDDDEESELTQERAQRKLRVKHAMRVRSFGSHVLADLFDAKLEDGNRLLPNLELHFVSDKPYLPINQQGGAVIECLWHRNAFSRAHKAQETRLTVGSRVQRKFAAVQRRLQNFSPEQAEQCQNWFNGLLGADVKDDPSGETMSVTTTPPVPSSLTPGDQDPIDTLHSPQLDPEPMESED